jgi:hypothetical protein
MIGLPDSRSHFPKGILNWVVAAIAITARAAIPMQRVPARVKLLCMDLFPFRDLDASVFKYLCISQFHPSKLG